MSSTTGGEGGFQLAQLIESMNFGNNNLANSILNRIGTPNDLGFKNITKPFTEDKDNKDIN